MCITLFFQSTIILVDDFGMALLLFHHRLEIWIKTLPLKICQLGSTVLVCNSVYFAVPSFACLKMCLDNFTIHIISIVCVPSKFEYRTFYFLLMCVFRTIKHSHE